MQLAVYLSLVFPISRDPPEGGTSRNRVEPGRETQWFPISRDPPEGGTVPPFIRDKEHPGVSNF